VLGEAALAIAAPWGQQAMDLPLPDERPEMLKVQYDLLLQMARLDLLEHQQHDADLHKALTLLDQARAIQQPSRGYFQLRSRCLTVLNDRPAAKQEADRAVLPDTPVTAVDHFLQGELLRFEDAGSGARMIDDDGKLRREHLDNAIEEYRAALQQNPRHYWAQLQLGRCLLALGRGPQAIEALSTCIVMRPAAPWAYTTRGLANALSGRAHEALADLDRAVQLDPLFQPARLNRGVVHWLQASNGAAPADFDAALADFTAVLDAPADQCLSEAGFYRGQLLLKMQRDRDALSDFSTVIHANPSFRAAYWFRAQTQFRLGHYAEGQADLVTFSALAERPPNGSSPTQTHSVRGKALRLLAQELDGAARSEALREAAEQLQAAIASDARNTEAFQQFGAVRQLQGKLPAAIESYSQGLKISAENVELRNLRGWAYSGENQSELARADFSEAVRRAPDNPESHTGLGYVLAKAGAADAAQSEVSAALLSGADNYLVLHNVACIYGRLSQSQPERKNDHENSALTALKRAVSLWRQSPAVHDANEIELIRHEEAFPDSLRSRPEFRCLLTADGIGDH
jgi:tetratricopeptide (TPR) repeat protein